MKKYLALIKLLLTQQFRYKPLADKKKRAGTIALFVVVGVCLLPTFAIFAVGLFAIGTIVGLDEGVVSLVILMCQGVVLVFGTLTSMSVIFNGKDAEKMLCLPIPSTTVFLAKVTVAYIGETITSALTALMFLLPFGLGAGAGAGYFLMLLPALLLMPVLPTLLGIIVSMPFVALFQRLRTNAVLKSVLQIVLYIAFMAAYMAMIFSFTSLGNSIDSSGQTEAEMLQNLANALKLAGSRTVFVHCNFMLATSLVSLSFANWIISLLACIAENALIVAFAALISLPFYRWILSSSLESTGNTKSTAEDLSKWHHKRGTLIKELAMNDFRRVLRDSQMSLQSLSGVILMPLLIVLFYFSFNAGSGEDNMLLFLSSSKLYQAIAPVVFLGYMGMIGVGMNVLGIYPISRENKALWHLKALPVPFEKILLAKVLLATVVMLVCDFLTCVLLVVFFKISWYIGIVMMIVMSLTGFGSMCITTLSDLKSPKLGWTNFNQSLKNAKNSWIAMLVGLLVMLGVAVLSVGFIVWYALADSVFALVAMWIVIAVASAVFAVYSYKYMASRAKNYFEMIEA